ncbi:AbrB/MazE/SpoVT family DNA-binding domain-containing protein [Desulfosudis oleivorans]|uniref:Transcriptional regulator, AbrB family n=1 Tax=Desulfosudis oleivorans (strain DSM 6200 / JCM 39069 / Hxd3) TaxID=96561 RepID=A9A0K1_DESOH|nr:AbrB/MazE/SpoVT family DNA-binding domain-containing protein [Desulfosudis oleivorans]ABW67501.1 transcriptional regulator, AbrB family [Desulfosudis oleivorans Hxd3]
MPLATLTGKGQITIPVSVRQALGLHAGDKLEFVLNENGEVICKPVVKRVDDVFGRLHKPGRKTVSVEAMDAAIRRKLQERAK